MGWEQPARDCLQGETAMGCGGDGDSQGHRVSRVCLPPCWQSYMSVMAHREPERRGTGGNRDANASAMAFQTEGCDVMLR